MSRRAPSPSGAPPPFRPGPGADALSVVLKTGIEDRPTKRDVAETRYAARVLGVLEQAEKPMPVDDLAQQARMGLVRLSKLLLDMQQRGAVVMEGHPGAETVTLGQLDV